MRRYALRDDQWDRIKDFLPGREGHVGGTAADNRLFVEAVLFRFRAGVPWRDLPGRFGDWKIIYQRFNRWAKSGVFERIFKMLASDHDNEYMMIDATIVRAHQHSAGAQKKRRTSNRPIPRRTDHQDSRPRRCARQSRRCDAHPGSSSRLELRGAVARRRRSGSFNRRQGIRRRSAPRHSRPARNRPGDPAQSQS
jgi:transposase